MVLRSLVRCPWVASLAFASFACTPPTTGGVATESNADAGRPNASETGGPIPVACGNGLRESGEACDDGNEVWGDGCNPDCELGGTTKWARVYASELVNLRDFHLSSDGGAGLVLAYSGQEQQVSGLWFRRTRLIALDANGEVRWELQSDDEEVTVIPMALSAEGGTTYLFERRTSVDRLRLRAIDTTGQERWRLDFDEAYDRADATAMTLNDGRLALAFDAGAELHLFRVEAETGTIEETASLPTNSPFGFDAGSLSFDHDGKTVWIGLSSNGPDGASIYRWDEGLWPRPWRILGYSALTHLVSGPEHIVAVAADFIGADPVILTLGLDGELLSTVRPGHGGGGDFGGDYAFRDFVVSSRGDYVGTHWNTGFISRLTPDGIDRWRRVFDNGQVWPELLTELDGRPYIGGGTGQHSVWVAELAP